CHFGWQLKAGRRYRVLVTTGSGLYRYDTRDMVLVVGHADGTPRLRFVGRAGAATDLCGEKLTDEFVLESLERSGISSVSYALLAAMPTPRPHYRLYVESRSPSSDPSLGERLDGALSSNPQYEYARRMGQLSGVVTCHVKDLYGRVKRHRLRSG